ncbi:hypothetical protein, partial [Thermogemmatispora tikiterensis]|uniref:hypothetical protein n=1 Tax=Thermogemmatispora tikiterensis TaxID=1825093 RepID=UPI001CB901D8
VPPLEEHLERLPSSRFDDPKKAVTADRLRAVIMPATVAIRRPEKPFEDRCVGRRVPRSSK